MKSWGDEVMDDAGSGTTELLSAKGKRGRV